jgi:hypothetical protein
MSDDEFRNETEHSPIGDAPPPKTARARKGSGRKGNGEAPDEFEPTLIQNADYQPFDVKPGSGPDGETTAEDLDEDAREFARLRRDLPNVQGSAAAGVVSIGVAKAPPKNEFFRTKKGFRPVVDIVVDEVNMDTKFYAVDPRMAEALFSIGIAFAPHTLYLIMTTKGAIRVIPVRCPDADGARNDYASTKELAFREAEDGWLRIYTDRENGCYRKFPAPKDRFPPPVWPELSDAKIFRLCFRDRGTLIDSPNHPRFIDWAALKAKDNG